MRKKRRQDPRIRRTRSLFSDALIELLQTRKLSEINIKQIADKAGVSRQAFYSHYRCKEELLFSHIDEIFSRIESEFDALDSTSRDLRQCLPQLFKTLFQTWQENIDDLQLVFQVEDKDAVIARLRSNISHLIAGVLNIGTEEIVTSGTGAYRLDVVTGGLYMILKRWIEEEMRISPCQIAELSADIFEGFLQYIPEGKKT